MSIIQLHYASPCPTAAFNSFSSTRKSHLLISFQVKYPIPLFEYFLCSTLSHVLSLGLNTHFSKSGGKYLALLPLDLSAVFHPISVGPHFPWQNLRDVIPMHFSLASCTSFSSFNRSSMLAFFQAPGVPRNSSIAFSSS